MDALILVDLQNDFTPSGALPVPDGDEVVSIANRLMPRFDRVIATQDWHPPNHGSFAANHPGKKPGETIELNGLEQVLWPVHCVQDTPGAALLSALDTTRIAHVFRKGTDPDFDSYSGFFDNGHHNATGLGDYLKDRRVDRVFIMGLATDYCVKFTALDARSLGFETCLIEDGCRGVGLNPGDIDAALAEMRAANVENVKSEDLFR